MGCGESKQEITLEEIALIQAEKTLLYSNYTPQALDFVYRKYSTNGFINENQWADIHKNLNLALSTKYPDPKLIAFYSSFKIKAKYPLKEVLLLAIILSQDQKNRKLELIFEIFDEENEKRLSQAKVKELCLLLIDFALEKMSLLVDYNKITRDSIVVYIQKLRMLKSFAINELVGMILGDAEYITLNEFVENLRKPSASSIMTLHGIRSYLKKQEILSDRFKNTSTSRRQLVRQQSLIEEDNEESSSIIVERFHDKLSAKKGKSSDIIRLDSKLYLETA
ncbi:hypothetical protein SteCoe_19781 [Stentor coeruleus]|uniref:EF-hand domain-containing protein n=1 Tax=Stentor coeruleus TaxID=5963 RepID=A0A1R2BTB1_9CILI|nr:hypothetical protein SteCoe_19781 [Stentor coeruleus]